MPLVFTIIPPIISYLIGSIAFGFVLVKLIKGVDIREHGSKNIGATNAGRVAGKAFGITAFVLDMLKGFIPVATVYYVYDNFCQTTGAEMEAGRSALAMVCGIAAILGHVFPVYLKFKGGKAAATSCGVFLFLAPTALGIAFAIWALTVFISKYISLGTMLASIVFAVSVIYTTAGPFKEGIFLTIFSIVMSIAIVILHRSNIKRIIEGCENRIGSKRKSENE